MSLSGRDCNRVQLQLRAAAAWPYLQLPRWLILYVSAVVTADIVAITLAARSGLAAAAIGPGDLLTFGALMVCAAITVELTRRAGESALYYKDISGIWELPVAILLPPVFALIAPIVRVGMQQWRIRRIAPHRRVFTAAAAGLSYGAVSLAFRAMSGSSALSLTGPRLAAAGWILAVAVCGILQWVVINSLLMPALKGSDRSASIRSLLFARESLHNDVTEISVATVIAVGTAVTPATLLVALPFVSLLQRSARHAQLLDASRLDAKTGLLNAVTWRREASAELVRAQRTGTSLAVALIDIDHFKDVNDTFGHLAGDDALREIGEAIRRSVREYDMPGRFGGEEFSLLLPQADAAGAHAMAERIRAEIAALRVVSASASSSEPITLTASIGVAVLDRRDADLTELLATADMSLYQAKDAGRNQVRTTTDTQAHGQVALQVSQAAGQIQQP